MSSFFDTSVPGAEVVLMAQQTAIARACEQVAMARSEVPSSDAMRWRSRAHTRYSERLVELNQQLDQAWHQLEIARQASAASLTRALSEGH